LLLDAYGAPTFYDKLLAVPILNVTIPARSPRTDEGAGRSTLPHRRRLRRVAETGVHRIWIVVFGAMSAERGVGDTVPGHWVAVLATGVSDRRHNACPTLALFEDQYCGAGSGWACNEAGILFVARTLRSRGRCSIGVRDRLRAGCAQPGAARGARRHAAALRPASGRHRSCSARAKDRCPRCHRASSTIALALKVVCRVRPARTDPLLQDRRFSVDTVQWMSARPASALRQLATFS